MSKDGSRYFVIKVNAELVDEDLDSILTFIKESDEGESSIWEMGDTVLVHCCSFRSESTMLAVMNALRDDGIVERRDKRQGRRFDTRREIEDRRINSRGTRRT